MGPSFRTERTNFHPTDKKVARILSADNPVVSPFRVPCLDPINGASHLTVHMYVGTSTSSTIEDFKLIDEISLSSILRQKRLAFDSTNNDSGIEKNTSFAVAS